MGSVYRRISVCTAELEKGTGIIHLSRVFLLFIHLPEGHAAIPIFFFKISSPISGVCSLTWNLQNSLTDALTGIPVFISPLKVCFAEDFAALCHERRKYMFVF